MARTKSGVDNTSIYEAALEGLLLQRQRIDDQIQQVRSLLGSKPGRKPAAQTESAAPAAPKSTRKRVLSEAARKRIAAAQKKRWAEYRKKSGSDQ